MSLRVLMFGWEFPPYRSGGLGTACHDLTKGLSRKGVKTTFVMPIAPKDAKTRFVKLVGATDKIKMKGVDSPITGYMNPGTYEEAYAYLPSNMKHLYGRNLFLEVKRFAALAKQIAKEEEHDIIHAHDWMTYEAGINARKASGKPLVVHLHATEFDRSGGNPNPEVSHIEWLGLSQADKVITNSNFSKQNIIRHYNIDPNKIDVVHWGIGDQKIPASEKNPAQDKTVLFLGRITLQKGPDYFIEVAKKVLEHEPHTRFVIAGDGDMLPRILNRAAELEITDKVIFTGALTHKDAYRAFQTADLYVMPSVSEPFGLVALESLKNGTPIIISKQSGVSEVINHALKVDFWDIDEMTNKIVSVLRHEALLEDLKDNGTQEVQKFNIYEPAEKVIKVYHEVLKRKH